MSAADSESMTLLEHEAGVPLLFGLMLSGLVSLGLWAGAWWLSSLIAY